MRTSNIKTSGGFIALFTVIIISFTLLLMATTLNFAGLAGRFNIFNSESKERSANLAFACVEGARIAIVSGNYVNGATAPLIIEGEGCEYKINNNNKIIAWSEVNNAYTYYWAQIDSNFIISDLKECVDLSPCP